MKPTRSTPLRARSNGAANGKGVAGTSRRAQTEQFWRAYYEVAIGREHHDHLICDSCARIVEFLDAHIERIQQQTAAEHGFVLLRHRHELFGLCERCHGRGTDALTK